MYHLVDETWAGAPICQYLHPFAGRNTQQLRMNDKIITTECHILKLFENIYFAP